MSRTVVALTFLLTACMTPPERPRTGQNGKTGGSGGDEEEGTGGKGTGGNKGTGGKGTGGSATGGRDGTGGSAGKEDASVEPDSGGSLPADAGAKKDAAVDFAKPTADGTWDKLNLVLANCVYCHNDPTKRLNLQYDKLETRLINAVAEKSPANCANRVVVVPGDPMQSLLYLKVSGKMPANCGARMPYNKPPVTDMELKIVYEWILAGAPTK